MPDRPAGVGALAGQALRRPGGRRAVSVLSIVLFLAGVVMFAYPVGTDVAAGLRQGNLKSALQDPSYEQAYRLRTIKVGEGLTRLVIPKLDVDVLVVEGTTPSALRAGAGHYADTPLPGQAGNVAIAGSPHHFRPAVQPARRDGHGRHRRAVHPVREVHLHRGPRVRGPRQPLARLAPATPASSPRTGADHWLTLTTCHPKGSARQRLILRLQLTRTEPVSPADRRHERRAPCRGGDGPAARRADGRLGLGGHHPRRSGPGRARPGWSRCGRTSTRPPTRPASPCAGPATPRRWRWPRTPAATRSSPAATSAFDLDTRCARYPAGKACSSPVVARNGVWTVALSGGQTATRDVVIAVPAATPRGVSATGTSPTLLTVSWARGAEPDVTWSVLEGRTVLVADLTPADACDDKGRCSATFSYPADADRSRTVVVRADRACPSCGGAALAPADSDPATATLPDAPAPSSSPSAGPSASGGPSARPGSSGAPGTGTADRGGIEKAIGTFVRPPSTIRLPAAPRASTAAVPAAAGQPDTFGKTLDYGDQSRTVVEKDGAPVLTQVGNALSSVGGALDAERAWKAGAGALLLIMVGVHLRVWLAAPGRG